MTSPLIYEVTLDIDAGSAGEFDAWLKTHVQEMLALPGFHDARVLKPDGAEPGTERRVVQYTLGSRTELDHYLAEHAPRMRADGAKRFGDRMKTSRRVLDLETTANNATLALPGLVLPPEGPRCRNCGTPLTGKFCMECGQKNHTYVAPLWNVLHDFAATHFGFDTKFFHSIVPLLFRPGFLSNEFCLGHEERYVKPFRLYLFSSILFFFLAAIFWPQMGVDSNSTKGKDKDVGAVVAKTTPEESRAAIQSARLQIDAQPGNTADKRFAEKILDEELAAIGAAAEASKAKAIAAASKNQAAAITGKPAVPTAGITVTPGLPQDGGFITVDTSDDKPGTKLRDSDNGFVRALDNIKDHKEEFEKNLIQNLPKMMFVLMPLIALFLKLFYIFSKRYLTEHFVFTLHYHSMLFVVLLLVMLAQSLAHHFAWAAPLKSAGTVAVWYSILYMFLALRFFYKQGWFMTSLKFFMISISYIIAISLTALAGVMLTAAEIAAPV